jgi:hypothetical protein
MYNFIGTGIGAADLIEIAIAKHTPDAITRRILLAKQARVFKEEADV